MMREISLMDSVYLSAKNTLEQIPIETSAPCRIDSGGTWDIKAMALPLERIEPATINMALSLRTRIELSPFRDGWVKVTSDGFAHVEEYRIKNLSFNSPFGLFFAAINHFGFHGLKVNIRSDSPVKSALGGSSTALVALIKALSQLRKIREGKALSNKEILNLGYHLEDGISGGNCGIQDQAAAVYGGVNRWIWVFGNKGSLSKRERLLDRKGEKEISDCIIVAYSGKSHASAAINRSWIKDFLAGQTRAGWIEANDIVNNLAKAIKKKDWEKASSLLKDEMEVRRKITPDALIPITEKLIDLAENTGCGARFTGAGAGGSVWAIGEPDRIGDLRGIWETALVPIKGAGILNCTVDSAGVR
ncbi:galactokinase [Deltaproteobacteria bacterium]|nr:galactokinase [Deltaproteobacteria bacterium]